jgi:hypothetical protein
MAAMVRWQKEPASRRLAVWMAVGAAFVLGLAASEYSSSAQPMPVTAWLLLPVLGVLVAGLVPIAARRLNGARFRLTLLSGGAPRGATGVTEGRSRQRREPISFPVVGKK